MIRFENVIPVAESEKLKLLIEKHSFSSLLGDEPIALNSGDIQWLKFLNGTASIKESFDLIYKKGFPAEFKKRLGLFAKLVDNKFFKNSAELRTMLNQWHAVNSGQWQNSSSLKVETSYFTAEKLIPLIQKTTLFHSCERQKAELVLKAGTLKSYTTGDVIIKKGQLDKTFYILLQGEVGVIIPHPQGKLELIAVLTPWAVFGESSAVFNQPRNADVRALESVCVLEIDAHKLVSKENSKQFDEFKSIKSRLIINQLLAANPLFKGIPSDLLQLFLKNSRLEKHPKERFIIKQGEDSSVFYFILKGSVSVIKDDIPVRSLSEGHFFGEVATLMKEKRTASVVCEEETLVLSISGDKFIDVLSRNLSMAMKIEGEALARLQSHTNIFSTTASEVLWTDDETTEILQTLNHTKVDSDFFESSATQLNIEFLNFSEQD